MRYASEKKLNKVGQIVGFFKMIKIKKNNFLGFNLKFLIEPCKNVIDSNYTSLNLKN